MVEIRNKITPVKRLLKPGIGNHIPLLTAHDRFRQQMQKFLRLKKPTNAQPTLLVVDNHLSQVFKATPHHEQGSRRISALCSEMDFSSMQKS